MGDSFEVERTDFCSVLRWRPHCWNAVDVPHQRLWRLHLLISLLLCAHNELFRRRIELYNPYTFRLADQQGFNIMQRVARLLEWVVSATVHIYSFGCLSMFHHHLVWFGNCSFSNVL